MPIELFLRHMFSEKTTVMIRRCRRRMCNGLNTIIRILNIYSLTNILNVY